MILSSKNHSHLLISFQYCINHLIHGTYCIHNFKHGRFTHDEEAVDDQEESGWKNIHGDVFRYPRYKSLFAAAIGTGSQLFTL